MQALIHPDLIVAAGFTDASSTIDLVQDLYTINSLIDDCECIKFKKPKNILEILIDSDLYPSESLFKKNLANQDLLDIYSSKDIINIIHQIIQKTDDYASSIEIEIEIEIKDPVVYPTKNHPNLTNNSLLTNEYFSISLMANQENIRQTSVLQSNISAVKSVNIKASSIEIFDELGNLEEKSGHADNINLLANLNEFLLSLGSEIIYSKATNLEIYNLALHLKTLEILKESNNSLHEIAYSFGSRFFESLIEYQCSPNDKFGSVCFDTIARIILGIPKNEIKPFRVSATSQEQRTRNEDVAFRSHVTKSNEGIRLMYWQKKSGSIEFSNVGNKKNLAIYE